MNPLINCKFCNKEMSLSSCDVFICKNHKNMLVIYDDISKKFPFWSIAKDGFEIGNVYTPPIKTIQKIILFPHNSTVEVYHSDMLLNGFYYAGNLNNKGIIIDINISISPDNFDNVLKRIKPLLPFL